MFRWSREARARHLLEWLDDGADGWQAAIGAWRQQAADAHARWEASQAEVAALRACLDREAAPGWEDRDAFHRAQQAVWDAGEARRARRIPRLLPRPAPPER